MSVKYILAPALVCTLMHLALLLGDGEGSTNGALGMVQAVLSCVVLLASGLLPALQILLRGRPDRDSSSESGTRAEVGIFALLVLALGLGLLLQFLLALVLRAVAPPLTAWPMAALALGSLLLIVGIGTRRGWPRVRTEPGLGGLALVLALLITVIVAIAAGPRLFDGPERMVLMSGKHWVDMLTGHGPPPLPVGVTVAPVRGLEQLEPGHYQATHPNICLGITNTLGREVKGALRLVASGRPDLDLHLLGVIPGACGGCKSPTAGGSPSASVSLPSTIQDLNLLDYLPRTRALLLAKVRLPPGDSCAHLLMEGSGSPPTGKVQLHQVSHAPSNRLDIAGGTLTLVEQGKLECHIRDAQYRRAMRWTNILDPNLLLWGYFTSMVVEVLSGATYPALGVLFLALSLLCFMAAQVLLGAVSSEGAARRLPGLLLLGPYTAHLVSMVTSPRFSFVFPDTAYTVLVLGAMALLMRRERAGFIILGCLAAYTRYPGGYVMALALFARLALYSDDRAWTRVTLKWSLVSGAAVVVLLLLYFHFTSGVGEMFQSIYFEVFTEHFTPPNSSQVIIPSSVGRAGIFCIKLAVLSSFTLLLWPFVRGPAGLLLVVVCIGYALPLMTVIFPKSSYFQPLLYMAAAAGLGTLSEPRRRALRLAAPLLVLAGTALVLFVDDLVFFFYLP